MKNIAIGQKISSMNYTVIDFKQTSADFSCYVLAVKETAQGKEFATWLVGNDNHCYHGHYFTSWSYNSDEEQLQAARNDFDNR